MSYDHMTQVYATSRLGTISSFLQNLVHIKYPILKLSLSQCKRVITKWDKIVIKKLLLNVTEVYCKLRQVLQSTPGITKCDRRLL